MRRNGDDVYVTSPSTFCQRRLFLWRCIPLVEISCMELHTYQIAYLCGSRVSPLISIIIPVMSPPTLCISNKSIPHTISFRMCSLFQRKKDRLAIQGYLIGQVWGDWDWSMVYAWLGSCTGLSGPTSEGTTLQLGPVTSLKTKLPHCTPG